ncbi:hypothetical protein L4D76_24465 [Photobacterium sagamiensis]|uniref:hypothetical protein n=1 Tax=Photobacterium sagamiensis TaxID=2910241 RepID=UPI003D151E49
MANTVEHVDFTIAPGTDEIECSVWIFNLHVRTENWPAILTEEEFIVNGVKVTNWNSLDQLVAS